jgi:hypothetical protein
MKGLLLAVTLFSFWDKNFLETLGLAAAPTQPQAQRVLKIFKKKAVFLGIRLLQTWLPFVNEYRNALLEIPQEFLYHGLLEMAI